MSYRKRLAWLKAHGHRLKRTPQDAAAVYKYLSQFAPLDGMIEIGTYHGATLFLFSAHVDDNSHVIAVDSFYGDKKASKREKKKITTCEDRTNSTIRRMRIEGCNVTLVKADSAAALPSVKDILGKKQVDFLHIDGGHSYKVARGDFDNYSPLVRPGGVILIHDIKNPGCEVPKLWAELKEEYGDRAIDDEALLGKDSGVILL